MMQAIVNCMNTVGRISAWYDSADTDLKKPVIQNGKHLSVTNVVFAHILPAESGKSDIWCFVSREDG